MIGSVIYTTSKNLITRYEIDDPMDTSVVHGACGIWSILALSFFDLDYGMIYTGSGQQVSIQLIGVIAYTVWALLLSFMFFYSLKKSDRLRVDYITEIVGLDFDITKEAPTVRNSYNRLLDIGYKKTN